MILYNSSIRQTKTGKKGKAVSIPTLRNNLPKLLFLSNQ